MRPVVLASGVPNGPVGALEGMTGGVAPSPLAVGNAGATWLKAGAADAQPGGTDNAPSEAARPTPAVIAAPPIPDEPEAPAAELHPLLSVDPRTGNPLPKGLLAAPIELMSEFAEPSMDIPDVDIADVAGPDSRLVAEVSAVDDDVIVVNDDSVDDDETEVAVEASPCSALGTAAEVSGVDNVELSGDTTCRPVPAEVPAAWVTAAANPVNPAGLVVCAGGVNDVNAEAAADAPA
jgi:hypothetical protein